MVHKWGFSVVHNHALLLCVVYKATALYYYSYPALETELAVTLNRHQLLISCVGCVGCVFWNAAPWQIIIVFIIMCARALRR